MGEETKKFTVKVPKLNFWMISSILLGLGLLVVLFSGFSMTGMAVLSPEQAKNKAIDYINNNLVQSGTVTAISVEDIGSVYKILTSYQGQQISVYVAKDGSYLFLQGFDMSKSIERKQEQQEFDAPDAEKPNVKFFVMSFCPYGNQAESGLEPVFRLLGDKVEWEPHYVIYSDYASRFGADWSNYCLDEEEKYCSMHGIQELNQDVREICVWKYYPADTWWDFVMEINSKCDYSNVDTCWEPIAEKFGIDVEKIKTCQRDEAVELLEEEVNLNKEYEVSGSPTVFINDEEYRGSRSPEAYKQAICTGFITELEECSQTLSGGSTSSGQC